MTPAELTSVHPTGDPFAEAKAFNTAHEVGTLVDYWRGIRNGDPSGRGPTEHRAMVLSGHAAVVWIGGCSGAMALSHVQVVEPAEVTRG